MSDDRKYRQRGYQERDDRGSQRPSGPQAPREKKDGPPRGRGLGAPTESVFRCAKCGADLHTCSNCIHFDTSARWECRQFEAIPAKILKKSTRNECTLFTPKLAQEFAKDSDKPAPGDARAAFDALFKL